ncbi:FMN reductase [Sphingobium sp. SA916]|nr:FMN reductase [Sphingobium sp. SA916]
MFRDAMACVGAAAHIVTSDGPGGKVGFSATAVCSVTDAPPTLLICLNRSASVYEAVMKNRRICVNTIAPQHQALALLFGGKSAQSDRFSSGKWTDVKGVPPVLKDALVSFNGLISETSRIGTHDILYVELDEIRINPDNNKGVVYFQRDFYEVAAHIASL